MRLFALILLVFPFFLNSQSIEIGKRIPASGETSYTDTLYIFDEGNASFTGGFLGFTPTWSPDDVGFGSFSYGVGPQASGFYSLAIGVQAKSEGLYSIALGNNVNALSESSIAIGSYASAEGQNTFATGESSRAIGLGSVAIGQSTRTEGMNSLAMGLAAKAKGVSSVAMGYLSEAEGNYSMAMGQGLEASSYNEVTIGSFNSIITPQSNNNWIAEDRLFVIGNGSGLGQTPERSDAMVVLKNGDVSFPDGDFLVGRENRPQPNVVSSGKLAFFDTEKGALRGGGLEVSKVWEIDSIGNYSIGLGLNVLAKGRASIALGSSAKARATGSICIGRTSQSEGGNSIGIGSFVSAIGGTSMALGYSSKSYGTYSISLGTFVNSPSYAEIVLGRYNTDYVPLSATSWNADDRLLVVGNGSSLGTKSDALTILKNGNTSINGNLNLKGESTIEAVNSSSDAILYTKSGTSPKTRVILHQRNTEDIFIGDIDGRGGSLRFRSNGADRLVITPAGNVAVKDGDLMTNTSTNDLGRTGSRWNTAWLTNGVNNSSDRRLKKNIADLNYGLSSIIALRPVSYEWKENNVGTKLGLIAQELKEVIPEVVHVPEDPEEFMSVNYTELIPVLIEAVQEQQKIINDLEKTIKSHESHSSELKNLQKEVQWLKNQVSPMQATSKNSKK